MPPLSKPIAFRPVLLAALIAAAPAMTRAETLMDAIAVAYQTNPALRAQRAELRATDEGYVQARAGLGPQVSISSQLGYADARVQQGAFGFTSSTDYRAGTGQADLQAVQPLYTSGQSRAQVRTAAANIESARQSLRQAEAQLIVNVVTAYLDVRRDRQISQALQDEATALTRTFDETKAKGALGQLSKTDVAQAQARLLSAQAQLNLALGRLNASNAEYLAVVGKSPGDLEPEPELAGLPDRIEQALAAAEHNNPQILGAVANETSAREKLNQAKAADGPTVSLKLDAAVAPIEPYLPRQYDRSVSAALVVSKPLFTSGLNDSKVRQAQEEDNRAALTVEATRRGVAQQVSQAWEQLTATRSALIVQEQSVQAQAAAAQGDTVEERVGLRSTIELLNAQLELANDQITLLQSRHDEYVARAALMASMGVLETRLLIPDIEAYSPQAHLKRVESKGAAPWVPAIVLIDGIGGPSSKPPPLPDPLTPPIAPDRR